MDPVWSEERSRRIGEQIRWQICLIRPPPRWACSVSSAPRAPSGRPAPAVWPTGDCVGGTWYWNRYPGARCDIESLSYSYSFFPELEQEWNWAERYPTQPESLRYVIYVADRFDLHKDIAFNARVVSAVYDGSAQRWRVDPDTGETVDTQLLIMAAGWLSQSKLPEDSPCSLRS